LRAPARAQPAACSRLHNLGRGWFDSALWCWSGSKLQRTLSTSLRRVVLQRPNPFHETPNPFRIASIGQKLGGSLCSPKTTWNLSLPDLASACSRGLTLRELARVYFPLLARTLPKPAWPGFSLLARLPTLADACQCTLPAPARACSRLARAEATLLAPARATLHIFANAVPELTRRFAYALLAPAQPELDGTPGFLLGMPARPACQHPRAGMYSRRSE
jgi:hypothetical protein